MKNSRKSAIESGDRYYYTGEPCKHGHLSKRITITGGCRQCENERQNAKRKMIQEAINASSGD